MVATQTTKRFLTQEEVDRAKADKRIREEIKTKIEAALEIGKPTQVVADNRVATEGAIRHYSHGLGDQNPLYNDPWYARRSVHGSLLAPPSFLAGISWWFSTTMSRKIHNVDIPIRSFEAGVKCEWFRQIRENDSFTVIEVPTEVIDITREHTALQFLTLGKKIYKNQDNEVIAILTSTSASIVLTQKPDPKPGEFPETLASVKGPKPKQFTVEEIEDWYYRMQDEPIRGAEMRFWEDVNIGDPIPPVHRVWTMMEHVAFTTGIGAGAGSWKNAMRGRIGGPNDNPLGDWRKALDPESHLPDLSGIHMTDISGLRNGIPKANAAGVQIHCWMTHLITNWMGDAGFLKKIDEQVRRSLWRGSFALLKGEVVNKYVEGNDHVVEIKMTMEDHWGDVMVPDGRAYVVLPSRQMHNSVTGEQSLGPI